MRSNALQNGRPRDLWCKCNYCCFMGTPFWALIPGCIFFNGRVGLLHLALEPSKIVTTQIWSQFLFNYCKSSYKRLKLCKELVGYNFWNRKIELVLNNFNESQPKDRLKWKLGARYSEKTCWRSQNLHCENSKGR